MKTFAHLLDILRGEARGAALDDHSEHSSQTERQTVGGSVQDGETDIQVSSVDWPQFTGIVSRKLLFCLISVRVPLESLSVHRSWCIFFGIFLE